MEPRFDGNGVPTRFISLTFNLKYVAVICSMHDCVMPNDLLILWVGLGN